MNVKIINKLNIPYILVFLILFCSTTSEAQSMPSPPLNLPYLSVEMMKPDLRGVTNIDAISSIWYLGGYFPVYGKVISGFAEFPLSYYSDDQYSPLAYEQRIIDLKFLVGNPLLGLQFGKFGSVTGPYGTIAVRMPIVDEKKIFPIVYGIATDFERFDAFVPNHYSIQIGVGNRFEVLARNYNIRFHMGATAISVLPIQFASVSEYYLKYFGQFWLIFPKANVYFGLSGLAFISESGLILVEGNEQQLTFGFQIKSGQVWPGAFIRVPITDELKRRVNIVGGINLTFAVDY